MSNETSSIHNKGLKEKSETNITPARMMKDARHNENFIALLLIGKKMGSLNISKTSEKHKISLTIPEPTQIADQSV